MRRLMRSLRATTASSASHHRWPSRPRRADMVQRQDCADPADEGAHQHMRAAEIERLQARADDRFLQPVQAPILTPSLDDYPNPLLIIPCQGRETAPQKGHRGTV